MGLILKPAILHICQNCGEHGRFVLGDGSLSLEFCSREGAYRELERLLSENLITEEEVVFLKDEVYKSGLVKLDSQTRPGFQIACEAMNDQRMFGDQCNHGQDEDLPVM